MFKGTFRVLRGIQGVWFFANMCRITYSWNAYLTIFCQSTTFGNSRSRNSGRSVELGLNNIVTNPSQLNFIHMNMIVHTELDKRLGEEIEKYKEQNKNYE